jgi:hypothetical protein
LLDRSCGLANFKSVLSLLPGDPRHIGWTPCEDVIVVPEEAGEHKFLFGVEVGPDDYFLGCVGQAEVLVEIGPEGGRRHNSPLIVTLPPLLSRGYFHYSRRGKETRKYLT